MIRPDNELGVRIIINIFPRLRSTRSHISPDKRYILFRCQCIIISYIRIELNTYTRHTHAYTYYRRTQCFKLSTEPHSRRDGHNIIIICIAAVPLYQILL